MKTLITLTFLSALCVPLTAQNPQEASTPEKALMQQPSNNATDDVMPRLKQSEPGTKAMTMDEFIANPVHKSAAGVVRGSIVTEVETATE